MIRLSPRRPEHLSDIQYRTVVVRVAMNDRRQIVLGELIDTASTQTTRFKTWRGLIQALSHWLKNQPAPADRSQLKSKQS